MIIIGHISGGFDVAKCCFGYRAVHPPRRLAGETAPENCILVTVVIFLKRTYQRVLCKLIASVTAWHVEIILLMSEQLCRARRS